MDRILALDLATRVGWVIGAPGQEPTYGSFVVARPGTDTGAFLHSYYHWLAMQLEALKPAWVIYEAPFLPASTALETLEKLFGLSGITQMLALQNQIECRKIDNQVVSKWFVGHARFPGKTPREKRTLKKSACITACRACGFDPKNDDEADALAGWCYACSMLAPAVKERRWNGPLLGAAQ